MTVSDTGRRQPDIQSRPVRVHDPGTVLLELKLRPPTLRPGIVHRSGLIDRLRASHDAHVVTIVAPPGYGKTTLMAQWMEHETRPTAWLSLDRGDNDPATLLSYIVAALRRAGLIATDSLGDGRLTSDSVISQGVPKVAHALESHGGSGVLMIDHLESVRSRASNDAIAELTAHLPERVQLVLASRAHVRLPVALLRSQGALLELSASDLAMSGQEAQALLEAAGVDVSDDLDELMDRTEGWPVGLYLVGLAFKAGSPRRSAIQIRGDDRYVADYLRHEVLGRLSEQRVSFLTRTSILDRFTGPLCDHVLETTGSDRILESLEESNLLIVPLDRTRDWYRYHHLLRDLLHAELVRREPEWVAELNTRAAGWLEANHMPEAAIGHAQAAHDGDTVARIVATATRAMYAMGRAETVRTWLDWLERNASHDRYPNVAVLGALIHALSGDPAGTERWAAAAFGGDGDVGGGGLTPAGNLLRALLCRSGVGQMRADAAAARDGLSPDSEWYPAAIGVEGMACLWDEEPEQADWLFTQAAAVAEKLDALPTATLALAERALIAAAGRDWEMAEQLAARSLDLVRANGLELYATSALTFGVAARAAIRRGDVDGARQLLSQASNTRPLLSHAIPGLSVQALLEMVSAYIELSDVAGARRVLREASDILARRPDLGSLPAQYDEIKARLTALPGGTVGPSALTTAELRLLPLLITHLSFPEIGERLYISRHTVKTQAMSIYRKLGASSRSEAVERAREIGLLSA